VSQPACSAGRSAAGKVTEQVYVHTELMIVDDLYAELRKSSGLQTATVVGPDGAAQASGADEIHTDALGRIKLQFHFQSSGFDAAQGPDTTAATTWVRVLQRYAGAGMELQFIPRIGQEVLVDFIEGDIDRPLVVGALYNGRGEAGTPATPGGRAADVDLSAFAHSTDHAPGEQGNLADGHSPAWHGAASADLGAGGQRNAAAVSGIKTSQCTSEAV
jgi:type VI secretion system secreted protein VgrG